MHQHARHAHTQVTAIYYTVHTRINTKEGEEVQGVSVLLYSSARHERCALFLQATNPSGRDKLLLDAGYYEGSFVKGEMSGHGTVCLA